MFCLVPYATSGPYSESCSARCFREVQALCPFGPGPVQIQPSDRDWTEGRAKFSRHREGKGGKTMALGSPFANRFSLMAGYPWESAYKAAIKSVFNNLCAHICHEGVTQTIGVRLFSCGCSRRHVPSRMSPAFNIGAAVCTQPSRPVKRTETSANFTSVYEALQVVVISLSNKSPLSLRTCASFPQGNNT